MKSAAKSTVVGLLAHPFIHHCSAIRPYVDYVKLVIKLGAPMQSSKLRSRMPASWKAARINITPAGRDIPGALNPSANSTNFYTLTVCEPHLYPFDVSQLPAYLEAINGKLSLEHCQVEFGIDFFMTENRDAYKDKMVSFLVRLLSHLKHKDTLGLLGARVFCPYPQGTKGQGKRSQWVTYAEHGWTETLVRDGQSSPEFSTMETHLRHAMHPSGKGCTFYAGRSSGTVKTKVNGVPTPVWISGTELRAYFKIKDNGVDLPENQQRFRVEFVAPCQQPNFTLDPVAVLSGDNAAACTMAKFFAMVLPNHPLLSLIKQARGLQTAQVNTKLRNKIKREGRPLEGRCYRIGADNAWNRPSTNKFTAMARHMKCASFTVATASKATPVTTAPDKAAKTAEVQLPREKTHTETTTEVLASAHIGHATSTQHAPSALITTVSPPPTGDGGYSPYLITDDDLLRMVDELERAQG